MRYISMVLVVMKVGTSSVKPPKVSSSSSASASRTVSTTPARHKYVGQSLGPRSTTRIEWNLVVPINPTPGEEKFFERQRKRHTFALHLRGRTWLNAHMGRQPEIRQYFLEDAKQEVLKLISEMQLTVKELSSAHDAVGRLRKLQERLNGLDIHYQFGMATGAAAEEPTPPAAVLSIREDDVRIDVSPKHRRALRARPIVGSFSVQFDSEQSELRDAFFRAIDYGDPRSFRRR